jgi:glycosyltransferase involved in cell wall biosynthesis
VPVVLSNKAGVSEVLTHAHTSDPWDTFSNKNVIHNLRTNSEQLKAYVKDLEKDLKKTSWEKMGKEVVDIYSNLK